MEVRLHNFSPFIVFLTLPLAQFSFPGQHGLGYEQQNLKYRPEDACKCVCGQTHPRTQTYRHTQSQGYPHTDTQTHRHTDVDMHRQAYVPHSCTHTRTHTAHKNPAPTPSTEQDTWGAACLPQVKMLMRGRQPGQAPTRLR